MVLFEVCTYCESVFNNNRQGIFIECIYIYRNKNTVSL